MRRRPRRQIDVPHVADQPILNLPDRCTHAGGARAAEAEPETERKPNNTTVNVVKM